jgi:hypothetical protein
MILGREKMTDLTKLIDALDYNSASKINSHRVHELFLLLCEPISVENTKVVEGIRGTWYLDTPTLEANRAEIIVMLTELPDQFKTSGGGGWTFLNACNDREGNQWTGDHDRMEELLVMGMGLDLVGYLLPRDFWVVLPGGMPYFVVKL